MGYKEVFLSELIRSDQTGLLQGLHKQLIDRHLKFRASSNSDTLLYYVLDREGKQIGLVALRVPGPTIFSFPKTYWLRRAAAIDTALRGVPCSSIVETARAVSSSQHSMRQVIVSAETGEILLHVIDTLILEHARSILGKA
jgi:hypothetical protein